MRQLSFSWQGKKKITKTSQRYQYYAETSATPASSKLDSEWVGQTVVMSDVRPYGSIMQGLEELWDAQTNEDQTVNNSGK